VRNNMPLKLLSFFLFGITVTTSWGQLGETPDQCDQRYGTNHTPQSADGNWTFSREYTKNDCSITVRFITLSTGTKVVGWISYTPSSSSTKSNLVERNRIREAAASSWTPVEETKITQAMDPQMVELAKIHNEYIAETQATFTTVTGWRSIHCWISPTIYAADNGVSLIMFSDAYVKQLKHWQIQEPKLKH